LGLNAAHEINLSGTSAILFLTVPTPATAAGGWNLSYLGEAASSVGYALRQATEPSVVVVRSTVPPGTLDTFVKPLIEQTSGKPTGIGFTLASAPEFLRGKTALEDFLAPWMTVLASRDPQTLEKLVGIFEPFGGELRTFDNPVTAELIKVVHNAFNATKISFWNEIWQLCQELVVNADDIAPTVARSSEGSINPLYGIKGGSPYGDVDGIIKVGRDLGIDLHLLESVREVNEAMKKYESL